VSQSINPADLARIDKQVMRRREKRCQQKRADMAEVIIRNRLIAIGFVEVSKVETGRDHRGKHVRRVAGDWTMLSPFDGRGGLCEVKSHKGEETLGGDLRLHWTDLREHQPRRLDGYAKAGAWAFLAWVGPHGIALLSWRKLRAIGFAPGRGVGLAEVTACRLPDRFFLTASDLTPR
jgi:hypothetical protein